MDYITEYGCEKCGAQIMKAPPNQPDFINICSVCAHKNYPPFKHGFQSSTPIYSWLSEICTPDDFKELRRNPSNFIHTILNAKLIATGRQAIKIDSTEDIPILFVDKK